MVSPLSLQSWTISPGHPPGVPVDRCSVTVAVHSHEQSMNSRSLVCLWEEGSSGFFLSAVLVILQHSSVFRWYLREDSMTFMWTMQIFWILSAFTLPAGKVSNHLFDRGCLSLALDYVSKASHKRPGTKIAFFFFLIIVLFILFISKTPKDKNQKWQ